MYIYLPCLNIAVISTLSKRNLFLVMYKTELLYSRITGEGTCNFVEVDVGVATVGDAEVDVIWSILPDMMSKI